MEQLMIPHPEPQRRSTPAGRLLLVTGIVLAVAAGLPPTAAAQDTHYWAIQYGPVGQLVGGQLIGGVSDLSATFYNPGALALRNESSYLLSTESVQWEQVTTDVPASQAILDTSSSRFGTAPSLLAGVLPRWLGQDTRLAWSFLTRQKLETRLGQRLTNPFPGEGVHSAAESYVDEHVEEDWAGLTLSRQVSPSIGIGVTWYGIYRGQHTRKELSAQAVAPDASSIAVSGVTDVDYSHYRTLLKLGLAWQTAKWNAGVSITTPSLGVLGSGDAGYTVSIAGTDANGDGRPDPPVLSTQTVEGLASDYHSPWAVGFGVARRAGPTRFYASAEWYGAVDRFAVLAVPAGTPAAQGLGQQLRSVLNAGAGLEHVVSPEVSVYGAFHTDFSASSGPASQNVAVSDWDLYHVSGGVSFRVRDNRFTVGASWATGRKTRPVDSPIPPSELPSSSLGQDISIHYSKVTFLLGFVFGS
jgi:hypothetical protein